MSHNSGEVLSESGGGGPEKVLRGTGREDRRQGHDRKKGGGTQTIDAHLEPRKGFKVGSDGADVGAVEGALRRMGWGWPAHLIWGCCVRHTEGMESAVGWPCWDWGVVGGCGVRSDVRGRLDGHWGPAGGGEGCCAAAWEGGGECGFRCVRAEVLSRSEEQCVGSSFPQVSVVTCGHPVKAHFGMRAEGRSRLAHSRE